MLRTGDDDIAVGDEDVGHASVAMHAVHIEHLGLPVPHPHYGSLVVSVHELG